MCVGQLAARQTGGSENLTQRLHMVGACLSVGGVDEPNQQKCLYISVTYTYIYVFKYDVYIHICVCVCVSEFLRTSVKGQRHSHS